MNTTDGRFIAIVGLGAVLPDALDVPQFWENILNKRYSIIDVPPGRWSIDDYYDPDPTAPTKPTARSAAGSRASSSTGRDFISLPK